MPGAPSTGEVLVRGYSKHRDTGVWSVVLTKYDGDGGRIFWEEFPTFA